MDNDASEHMLPRASNTTTARTTAMTTRHALQIGQCVSALGAVFMTSVILYAVVNGNGSEELDWLLTHPWGVVSLVDLYVGFTLFSLWIFLREESAITALVWTVFVMCLGNFTTSVYVLRALRSSNGNWNKFFLGDSYASSVSATASR